jgi:UDP-2-acetamido-3-amino-2,3-dideoxy-glucuronate N-acetyltransferase
MTQIPQVAVIGSGYWGKNLVRTFRELKALRWVCDTREEALAELAARAEVRTTTRLEQVLGDKQVTAVAIAAPAVMHYDLTRECLLAGKDVFVEKPMALKVREGRELAELASRRERVLMVGHILEYHPAILELKKMIREGELGKIQYIYSSRLNIGKLRTEENILWSFAPHDISAILFLLNETPKRISTHGGSYLNQPLADTTLTTCEFQSGVMAHIFVSWLHPFKEQKLAIIGGRKMAVFDDTERERKLMLYSHRIDWINRAPVVQKDAGQEVKLPAQEPLRLECEHFLGCVATRHTPRTGAESGVRVLEVLEACEQSLSARGQPVEVGQGTRSTIAYQAHPTAVIDSGCKIGEGTRIWHFSHVMSGASVGQNCNFGQNVVISPGVVIGDNVKIQNNVSVYTGVELEDDVFCGPSMVFTNVINPRSHVPRKDEYRRTVVRRGASIGANATIVCGVTLGKYCFVGAGAVVTHDVPDYALMVGVPAKQTGWVCYCGNQLTASAAPICSACHRQYLIGDGVCKETKTAEFEISVPPIKPAVLAAELLTDTPELVKPKLPEDLRVSRA